MCGIPACYRRIDERLLSFRVKWDSWKHSIHSTCCIETKYAYKHCTWMVWIVDKLHVATIMTITSYIELYEPISRPASIPITALYNGVLNFLIWSHGTMPKAVARDLHAWVHLSALRCIRLHSTAFDCIRPHSTAFDCIRLHLTAFDRIRLH